MRRAAVRAFGALVALATGSCSRAPAEVDAYRAAVINGEDDRLQAFEAPAEERAALLGASAALIFSHHLVEHDERSVSLRALAAGAALGLCDDERFASEPVAAFCSGVLIDEDLIATAGHCFGSDAELAAGRCRSTRVVFGYALSKSDGPVELDAARVFACRSVVALDDQIAVVQLDRTTAGSLSAPPLARVPPRSGDALIVASHGAGLPLKIELAAEVTDAAPESNTLTVAMDTFAGSSGGGVYNQDLELIGLIEDGAPDWEAVDGCTRAAHSETPRERAVGASHVTDVLCRAGWPSQRWCDTPSICGDGVCSGGELSACSEDCPGARCGDELCEPAERGVCREDCARYAGVPESWLDDPAKYAPPSEPAVQTRTPPSGCSVAARTHTTLPAVWLVLPLLLRARRYQRKARARGRAVRNFDAG